MNNNYYFYPPNKPQFFFPKKEFNEYQKYYTPYSALSKIFWFFFKNIKFLRIFFLISEEKIPLPIDNIKQLFNSKSGIFFFNLGTSGKQQKASIIASFNGVKYFMKFAQNETSRSLIKNEIDKLLYLENTQINSAKIINYDSNNDFAFLITNVISGNKINFTNINDQIIEILLEISKIEIVRNKDYIEVFSHGDFCPWNMLINSNNEITLIDWEMADLKPLGFDLFTYIFQTNYLVYKNKSNGIIIKENINYIESYFNKFKVIDWKSYLIKFMNLKILEEKNKTSTVLLQKYQQLKKEND